MGFYRWRPSRSARKDFAQKMTEIEEYCKVNGIEKSLSSDSYYFSVNGKKYRVSNHSVEASDAAAFNPFTGEQIRDLYHGGRSEDTIYIHASKTRLIEIHQALLAGKVLDGRGNPKN